jgi:hypothetical protein
MKRARILAGVGLGCAVGLIALLLYWSEGKAPVMPARETAVGGDGKPAEWSTPPASAAIRTEGRALDDDTLAALDRASDREFAASLSAYASNAAVATDERFRLLWRQYLALRSRQPERARLVLDELRPLVGPGNARAVYEAMMQAGTPDRERAQLMSVLSFVHDKLPDSATSPAPRTEAALTRQALVAGARQLAASADPRLAGEATLYLSRRDPDTARAIALVDSAQQRGLLVGIDYAREMLIQLPMLTDPAAQREHVQGLLAWSERRPEDAQAVRFLGPMLLGGADGSWLAPEPRLLLTRFFDAESPPIRSAAGLFEVDLAVGYVSRLEFRAALRGLREQSAVTFFYDTTAADTDPAALLALLISPYGPAVARVARDRGRTAELAQRMSDQASAVPPQSPQRIHWLAGREVLLTAAR